MAKDYRPADRDQVFLLPPDIREWLPDNHVVWFVIDTVKALDTSVFHAKSRRGSVGAAGYDPDLLLGVLIYAYLTGTLSSRAIERACVTDVAFRVLCAQDSPDHTTVARFRQAHDGAMANLFSQVLGLCAQAGLGDFRTVAVDGTKIAANASMSRNRTRSWLQGKARELLDAAAAVDAAEDAAEAAAGPQPPKDPAVTDPKRRREWIQEALAQQTADDDSAAAAAGGAAAGETTPGGDPSVAAPSRPARKDDDPDQRGFEFPTAHPTDVAGGVGAAPVPPGAVSAAERTADRAAVRFAGQVGAALTQIRVMEQARDDAARQPKVLRAQAAVDKAEARKAQVVAQVQARYDRQQEKIAAAAAAGNTIGRAGRCKPPAEHTVVAAAQAAVELKRGLLEVAQQSGRKPSKTPADPIGNLTDADSHVMMTSRRAFLQGYNAQLAVTSDGIIAAVHAGQTSPDTSFFLPMVAATVAAVDVMNAAAPGEQRRISTVLADAGYVSEANLDTQLTPDRADRLIAIGKRKDIDADAVRLAKPTRPGKEPSVFGKMAIKVAANRDLYKRRGATVEPVNAHLKDRRGLRRFSRRGITAVTAELQLAAAVTNLAKLFKLTNRPLATA